MTNEICEHDSLKRKCEICFLKDELKDMKHICGKDDFLYIFSMGKKLKVTAIFVNVENCNSHCSKTDDSVIAEFGTFIFCADKYDNGISQ